MVCVCLVCVDAQGDQLALMLLLRTKLPSSGRAASTLSHRAISAVLCFLNFILDLPQVFKSYNKASYLYALCLVLLRLPS